MEQTNFNNFSIGIYVRESRDENGENYETIETQRDLLIDFAAKNGLGEVKRIYIDDNVSGSSFERHGIKDLKDDVENREIDLLLVKDLSRLGRNNAKTLLFLDYLEEHGVRVVTADGRYDSARDNEMVGIETWINERYISDISRKIRASLRYKINSGEYLGHAPFGYRKSDTERNRLCIDEENAGVVRKIFSLYREGYGYSYIAKLLNSWGYPSPSGSKWNSSTIRRILTNRVYTGDTVQGVSEKVSYKSKKTRRLPKDRWIITQGTHEAIIEADEFRQVQEIREARKASLGPHRGKLHAFRGILFCGDCGSSMFARSRRNRPMGYICGSYARAGKSACTSHYVNEAFLKDILKNELGIILSDRGIIESIKHAFEKEISALDKNTQRVKKLKACIDEKLRQQEIAYRDRLNGNISEELFLKINREIEKSVLCLKNEVDRLSGLKRNYSDFNRVMEGFLSFVEEKGLNNSMVRSLVEKITVYDPLRAGTDKKLVVIDFKHRKV